MRKVLNLLLTIVLIITAASSSKAQNDIRMQSVFIYNFTRLMAWPADYQTGDFVMAVFGNSPMVIEFQDIAAKKKAGSQNIVAKVFNSVEEITKCHIIYIPSNQSRRIPEVVAALSAKDIKALLVTDSRNATSSGAVINFTIVDNRQRFELSQGNARKMGLTPGGEISRLAIVMD